MKSVMKRSLSLVLVLILAFSMSIGAFAADQKTISVQVDGKSVEMKYAPVVKNGITYVDFRSVPEALGAEVSYNYQKNEFTSVINGKSTVIKDAIVTNNGPFVSVRAIAQAAGYVVNWDADTKTVVILNIDKLLERFKGKFTIMDKYMAYASEFSSQNLSITGTMDMTMKVSEGDKSNNMAIKCKIDAISNSDIADMNMSMAADLTDILKNEDMSKIDETSKLLLKELGSTNFHIIYNMKDGMMYMQSKLFSMMAGIPEGSWLSIDFNEFFKAAGVDLNMSSLLEMSKVKTFDEYLANLVRLMPATSAESTETLMETLDMLEKYMSDSAFTKKGDDYSTTFKMDESDANVTVDYTIKMKNDKVVGYSMDAKVSALGSDVVKITANQGTDKVTMKMSLSIPSVAEANYDIAMQYNKTDKVPQSKPADGSKIISLNDMLSGLGM